MHRPLCLFLAGLLTLSLSGCAAAQPISPALTSAPPSTASCAGMTVTFFSCGKADSALVQADGYTLLIDTATNKAGKAVVRRLGEMDVTALDALLISHTHKDHVGGADLVLDALPVRAVWEGPLCVDSKQVTQYRRALDEQGLTPRVMRAGDRFTLGSLVVEALAPMRDAYEDENDLSLVLRLTYGETVFLFTGDIEKDAIGDLLASGQPLRADVLKVPHHGRGEDNSSLFFKAVSPSVAVIPCERETDDLLPDESRVVAPLQALGAQVFVTHDGEVCVHSDGKTLTVAQR